MGGWHDVPEQMMATVFLSFTAGRFGIVSASTGGRYCATASLVGSLTTDLLNANDATAASSSCCAVASSPTMTTCVCASEKSTAAIPEVAANMPYCGAIAAKTSRTDSAFSFNAASSV